MSEKILVMTVGTGRDRKDIAGALRFSIERHQPDRLLCFCSAKTRQETLPELEQQLGRTIPDEDIRVCADPDHVQRLYLEYAAELRALSEDADLVVDFTSGTKAMSAALFAACVAAGRGSVSYVVGERDQTGRVTASEDVISFTPADVLYDQHVQRARELFNQGDFHGSVVIVDPIRRAAKESPFYAAAKSLFLMGQAYEAWEHYQWKQAGRLLRKVLSPHEQLIPLDGKQIEANADFLQRCASEEYGPCRLVDMWLNARRRCRQGLFDDALARLYRTVEYLVQCRLHREYSISTGKVTIAALQDKGICPAALERYEKRARKNGGVFKLGLREGIELLAEMGDDLGKRLVNLYWKPGFWKPGMQPGELKGEMAGPLQNMLNQRNDSLLAHGTQPAKEDTVKCLMNTLEDLLQEFIPDPDSLLHQAEFVKMGESG